MHNLVLKKEKEISRNEKKTLKIRVVEIRIAAFCFGNLGVWVLVPASWQKMSP